MSSLARLALVAGCLAWATGCEAQSDTPSTGGGTTSSSAGEAPAGGSQGGMPGGGGAAAGGVSSGAAGAAGGMSGMSGMSGSAGSGSAKPLAGSPIVFVASSGGGGVVRAYDVDQQTGTLTQRGGDYDAGPSPSYLALNPARTHLYASSADAQGGVTALDIAPDGALSPRNQQVGSDGGFAHLAVDPSARFVLAAGYDGGCVSVFPILPDGSLAAEITNLDFGDGARAHAIAFDQSGEHVLVPTLGLDQIQHLLLSEAGALSPSAPAFVTTTAGAGPRHIAVHPGFELAFVVNETDSSVTPYALSAQGTLSAGTPISSLPPGFVAENSGAHIEVSPDGRFVYASNRGHDSIAVFAADQTSGALTLIEHEPTRGLTPRDFDVDPNGETLIVANQESDSLSVYALEPDGSLTPRGTPTPSAPSPRAVQFHYVAP